MMVCSSRRNEEEREGGCETYMFAEREGEESFLKGIWEGKREGGREGIKEGGKWRHKVSSL